MKLIKKGKALADERKGKLIGVFGLVAVAMLLLTTTVYASGLIGQNTTNTTGVVANVNLGVYKDRSCTQGLTSIDWGTIYPGNSVTVQAYVRNQGTVNMTLQKALSNWNPSTASSYLSVNWNYTGQIITPSQVVHLGLTLVVSPNVKDVTAFSFNINMTCTG